MIRELLAYARARRKWWLLPIIGLLAMLHRSSSVISPIDKIDGLLAGITKADIARMPPANRRRLAQVLRRIADIADPPPKRMVEIPKAGILGDLENGARAE